MRFRREDERRGGKGDKGEKKGKEICEDSVEDVSGEETDDGGDAVKALTSEEVREEAKRLLARWKDTKVKRTDVRGEVNEASPEVRVEGSAPLHWLLVSIGRIKPGL